MTIYGKRISTKLLFALLGIILSYLQSLGYPIPNEMIHTCWIFIGGQGLADIGYKIGKTKEDK